MAASKADASPADEGLLGPELGLHHLALRSQDVPRLRHFYLELIGLRELRHGASDSLWLQAGATVLMIEPAAAGEPAIPRGSLELLAFGVSASARDALQTKLLAAGVAIEASSEHTIYFRDPEGRRVGLSSYPLGSSF